MGPCLELGVPVRPSRDPLPVPDPYVEGGAVHVEGTGPHGLRNEVGVALGQQGYDGEKERQVCTSGDTDLEEGRKGRTSLGRVGSLRLRLSKRRSC